MNSTHLFRLVVTLLRPFSWLAWRWGQALPKGSGKRVLFVVYNDLTARYLEHLAQACQHHALASAYVTRAPFVARSLSTPQVIRRLRGRFMPFWKTFFVRWDAIVVADHYPVALYPSAIPKMFVTHGLYAGRHHSDTSYVYGKRAVRPNGTPVYHCMLATGDDELAIAAQASPHLDSIVVNAGDPQLQRLLAQQTQRNTLRRACGLHEDDCAVLIASSWGPDSLLMRDRDTIRQALRLPNNFHVILSIHPNNVSRDTNVAADTERFLRSLPRERVTVVPTEDDWQRYLTVADMMVTDYTSLGLYFACLDRPMVFTNFPSSSFSQHAPILKLRQLGSRWAEDDTDDLLQKLQTTRYTFRAGQFDSVTRSLIASSYSARNNHVRQLAKLLHVPLDLESTSDCMNASLADSLATMSSC